MYHLLHPETRPYILVVCVYQLVLKASGWFHYRRCYSLHYHSAGLFSLSAFAGKRILTFCDLMCVTTNQIYHLFKSQFEKIAQNMDSLIFHHMIRIFCSLLNMNFHCLSRRFRIHNV